MENGLITVRDVAAALKVSPRQVWKLAASGRLPGPIRLARSVRWRAADITRFIEVGCNMQAFEAQRALEQAEIERQRRAAGRPTGGRL